MLELKKYRWIYLGILLFIAINSLFVYNENYLFALSPLALLLGLALFFSLDKLLLALVFLVPLSIPLSELVPGLPIDMFLPTEPLLAGILLLFVTRLFTSNTVSPVILKHPVSITIYIYLGWMFITSLTSTMPVVSLKYFISRSWFIVAFYFLATQLFIEPKNAKKYITLYVYALVLVVFYALFRHLKFGIFDEKIAHWASNPFYKDHTSYGALLAFFIPPMIGITFFKEYSPRKRFLYGFLTIVLFAGLIFSYSRAAWVSLLGAFGIWVIIKLRIKLWFIITGLGVLAIFVLLIGNSLKRNLESNKQDSSTDLAEHVQSISNVSTDASNLERLNRWNCAIRMFTDKPVFGWGPGTYMFHYAPYQLSYEKTIISTNEGDMGNAHSEYLGPLSEQGFLGPLLFILIIFTTMVTAIRAVNNSIIKELRMLGIAAIAGLWTYYLHGILNNFLDTDKASVPFWGFTALLVAMDVYHKKITETTE